VTTEEVAGHWTLTGKSLQAVAVDGFKPKQREEIFIEIYTNGTYKCHTISRADEEGHWSLQYNPNDHLKNALALRTSQDAISLLQIALDAQKMILWKSWGDPDEGVDLVYEKVERSR
jgi:hypothetical protein